MTEYHTSKNPSTSQVLLWIIGVGLVVIIIIFKLTSFKAEEEKKRQVELQQIDVENRKKEEARLEKQRGEEKQREEENERTKHEYEKNAVQAENDRIKARLSEHQKMYFSIVRELEKNLISPYLFSETIITPTRTKKMGDGRVINKIIATSNDYWKVGFSEGYTDFKISRGINLHLKVDPSDRSYNDPSYLQSHTEVSTNREFTFTRNERGDLIAYVEKFKDWRNKSKTESLPYGVTRLLGKLGKQSINFKSPDAFQIGTYQFDDLDFEYLPKIIQATYRLEFQVVDSCNDSIKAKKAEEEYRLLEQKKKKQELLRVDEVLK